MFEYDLIWNLKSSMSIFCQERKQTLAQMDLQISSHITLRHFFFFLCGFETMCHAHHDKGMTGWATPCKLGYWSRFPLWSTSVQLPLVGTDVCLYCDGTRVTEEYFHTLSDNTELVLVPRGHTWSGGGKNTPIKIITVNASCFQITPALSNPSYGRHQTATLLGLVAQWAHQGGKRAAVCWWPCW